MSIRTYDRIEAQALIPFFQSIAFEVTERRSALRKLEASNLGAAPESDESIQNQADAANHRKEVRLALREITRLGCIITREFPLRVIIPGPGGEADGYFWNTGESVVEPCAAESAA